MDALPQPDDRIIIGYATIWRPLYLADHGAQVPRHLSVSLRRGPVEVVEMVNHPDHVSDAELQSHSSALPVAACFLTALVHLTTDAPDTMNGSSVFFTASGALDFW